LAQNRQRKDTGDRGEALAREYLAGNGCRIIETNCRCREGEIDFVARDDESIVFVEVLTKSGPGFGTPEESITHTKRQKLLAAAVMYRAGHDCPPLPGSTLWLSTSTAWTRPAASS
jgi:putative endonuclease